MDGVNVAASGIGTIGKKKGVRARFTTSRLAEPTTPIHALSSSFQDYLHFPDPMPLYITMGMMAGNMMHGTPIWLMLIGDSGGGKTAILKSILGLPRVRSVASLSGQAALLSGTSKKDRAEDATGGVLAELGDNGCMAFMDFTSVLSQGDKVITETLGVLRELFDRTWRRDIGSDGGRSLRHTGRVTLIAGVTHAIDRHASVNAEMGQRCLYYRLPWTIGYQESLKAINNTMPDGATEAMQQIVEAMFYAIGLSFERPVQRRDLTTSESDRVATLAYIGAKLRNTVPRDMRDRSVIDMPSSEVPTRMSQQLAQLYAGMEVVGVDEDDRWSALEHVVLDSMPLIRKRSLEIVAGGRDGNGGLKVTAASLGRKIAVSESTARRTLEDLELLGAIRKDKKDVGTEDDPKNGYRGGWVLTDWAEEKLGGLGVVRKWNGRKTE